MSFPLSVQLRRLVFGGLKRVGPLRSGLLWRLPSAVCLTPSVRRNSGVPPNGPKTGSGVQSARLGAEHVESELLNEQLAEELKERRQTEQREAESAEQRQADTSKIVISARMFFTLSLLTFGVVFFWNPIKKTVSDKILDSHFRKGFIVSAVRARHCHYSDNFVNGKCVRGHAFKDQLDEYLLYNPHFAVGVVGAKGMGKKEFTREYVREYVRKWGKEGVVSIEIDEDTFSHELFGLTTVHANNFRCVVAAAARYKGPRKPLLFVDVTFLNALSDANPEKLERVVSKIAYTVKFFVEKGKGKVILQLGTGNGEAMDYFMRKLESRLTLVEFTEELTAEQCSDIVRLQNDDVDTVVCDEWAAVLRSLTGGRATMVQMCAQLPTDKSLVDTRSKALQWVVNKTIATRYITAAMKAADIALGNDTKAFAKLKQSLRLLALNPSTSVHLDTSVKKVLEMHNIVRCNGDVMEFDNDLYKHVFAQADADYRYVPRIMTDNSHKEQTYFTQCTDDGESQLCPLSDDRDDKVME